MRFKCFLLLIGLGLVLVPGAFRSPLRVQPVGAGEQAAPAKRPATLDERWKQLTGGAAVWRRADATDPLRQFAFDLVAERVGAANGEVTREQFLAMADHPSVAARPTPPAAERPKQGERSPPVAERPKQGERRPPAPAAAPGGQPRASDESGPVPGARAEFRKRDLNGDGLLDYDEMDESLRAERDRWDANQDGFIDFAEFTAYLRARRRLEREAAQASKPAGAEGRVAKRRRGEPAADLPPNLPPWFKEYDTDGDGQIGLYEWKAAGQPIARFLAMDDNGDGFLTPDEVLAAMPPKAEVAAAKEPAEPKEVPRKEQNESPENAAGRSLRNFLMRGQVIQLDGTNGLIIRSGK